MPISPTNPNAFATPKTRSMNQTIKLCQGSLLKGKHVDFQSPPQLREAPWTTACPGKNRMCKFSQNRPLCSVALIVKTDPGFGPKIVAGNRSYEMLWATKCCISRMAIHQKLTVMCSLRVHLSSLSSLNSPSSVNPCDSSSEASSSASTVPICCRISGSKSLSDSARILGVKRLSSF